MAYGAAGDLGPVPPAAWRMAAAAREPEQAGRLTRFRNEHPEVIIGDLGFGRVWQAHWPHANGETVTSRHTLRELLDRLDECFPPDPQDSG